MAATGWARLARQRRCWAAALPGVELRVGGEAGALPSSTCALTAEEAEGAGAAAAAVRDVAVGAAGATARAAAGVAPSGSRGGGGGGVVGRRSSGRGTAALSGSGDGEYRGGASGDGRLVGTLVAAAGRAVALVCFGSLAKSSCRPVGGRNSLGGGDGGLRARRQGRRGEAPPLPRGEAASSIARRTAASCQPLGASRALSGRHAHRAARARRR